MSRQASSTNGRPKGGGLFAESLAVVAITVTNPLFLFGIVIGSPVGWGICWFIFVLPFHHNLADREAQLQNWSKLNMQMQTLASENRELSQTELKQFVAANQAAATSFMEVQRSLHDREIRLIQTPPSFILIPIALLLVTVGSIVAIFLALNQRALATVDQVLSLAPNEMVQEIVRRHIVIESTRTIPSIASTPSNANP